MIFYGKYVNVGNYSIHGSYGYGIFRYTYYIHVPQKSTIHGSVHHSFQDRWRSPLPVGESWEWLAIDPFQVVFYIPFPWIRKRGELDEHVHIFSFWMARSPTTRKIGKHLAGFTSLLTRLCVQSKELFHKKTSGFFAYFLVQNFPPGNLAKIQVPHLQDPGDDWIFSYILA